MNNSDIFEVKRLRLREHREKTGLLIVEGYTEVLRALSADVPVKKVYVCQELLADSIENLKLKCVEHITKEEFKRIAFGKRLKGILAICEPKKWTLETVRLSKNPFVVVLEGVEKPGNIGTVIRSCDGASVDCIICCDQKTDIYNQHVVRSSLGTLFHVPTIAATKEEALNFLKRNNLNIYAATAKAAYQYSNCDFNRPSAVIFGNEHLGVSSYLLENSDQAISIPMAGEATSLNIAMSASIIVYEANRQRGKTLEK